MTNRLHILILSGAFILTALPTSLFAQNNPEKSVSERDLINGETAYIEGLQEFESANYERALDLFSEAYVKLPENAGLNYAMADAYRQIGDLANASFYGKEAVKLEPENKWYRLMLAGIYREAGKNEATIGELEKILEYHPEATEVLAELADTYASYGMLMESNRAYSRLLKLTGENLNIHLQKLRNFNKLGIRDSVITELQKIRELDPDNLSTLQTLSNIYLEMEQPNEAKSILESALEQNKRDPKTLIMLADLYAKEAKWDSVGTMLGNVVSDPIIPADAKLTVAQYLFSQFQQHDDNTDLKEATSSVLETFIANEPDYGQAHALAADYYNNINENEKALTALARTNELMPSNDGAWIQRMQLLLTEGKYKEAINIGKQAEENVPQDPFVMYFWGSAYLAESQNAEAVEKLEEASRLPARRQLKSAIYNALGDAHAGLEQWEEAFNTYDEALKINPDNDLVLNNYAYFLSLQEKDLDKAQEMALKANRLSPNNPSYLDTVGWVYYQKGEYEKAEEFIRASLETGEASAEVMEHMGDVLDKLGRSNEAMEWWKKAYDKDSTRTHLKDKISR
ncbi:tetratricopeptide repeat protein [Balneolaceae bacterium YR4-1]|uniref:Tetratricopeptide repeat protein n=1 Tax=Halalkalibaculum roseum TaxID=2709311 RepID=A0A6M1SJW3_9BACT|nr:tetratricopeptide repeat protein [Halalkalibaculum roseum]NGP75309.1 tetratricopeptide repeat protein [Halalkalibaculum roseum]